MHDKLQVYHHHIEAEERADDVGTTTVAESNTEINSEEPPSGDPNSSPSDANIQDPSILLSIFPSKTLLEKLPPEEPLKVPNPGPRECTSGYLSNFTEFFPYDLRT